MLQGFEWVMEFCLTSWTKGSDFLSMTDVARFWHCVITHVSLLEGMNAAYFGAWEQNHSSPQHRTQEHIPNSPFLN